MAVLEALAHRVPCLLSGETNMADEVVAAGAGWRADLSAKSIAEALSALLRLDRSRFGAAAVRARRLAEENYTWDRVASETANEYARFALPYETGTAIPHSAQVLKAA